MQSVWLKAEEPESRYSSLSYWELPDKGFTCSLPSHEQPEKGKLQRCCGHTMGSKAGDQCRLWILDLKSVAQMYHSVEVSRKHHQGLPHSPLLHTWGYIIGTRSYEGMDYTLWAWLWQLKCGLQGTLERFFIASTRGSKGTKNCTAELSCARNPNIICLNSPGHCILTSLLL